MSTTIPAIGSTRSAAADQASSLTTPTVTSGKTLGMNDFMKLLATQFQQQDPMKPMDDTAFIAQTAQFTSLQQTSTLVQQITQLNAAQGLATANSYLGRNVTVDLGKGKTATGEVTAIDASGSEPQLILNDTSYPLSSVLRVEPGAATPAAAATTPTTADSSSSSTP
jgi:flagellar basal-body rod modification protein FlgD